MAGGPGPFRSGQKASTAPPAGPELLRVSMPRSGYATAALVSERTVERARVGQLTGTTTRTQQACGLLTTYAIKHARAHLPRRPPTHRARGAARYLPQPRAERAWTRTPAMRERMPTAHPPRHDGQAQEVHQRDPPQAGTAPVRWYPLARQP
jgi:hypothetical protein